MRNIMKRIFIFALALSMVFSNICYAEEKVEIKFSVGDETLTINGEPVKVEKPYVVGEGVTLVPLRVITEAFGAKVDWIGETKTITLDYPGVKIVLQIDNPAAEVNGKVESLLSAPELTSGGFTMVPLRFISETFGAVVSYDNETKAISVVKGGDADGTTVEGAISEKKIGDSYFGWTLENPTDMQMSERYLDGTYTEFTYDDENSFYIGFTLKDKDFDLNQTFNKIKSSLSKYTLVTADKDAGKNTIHIQAKDKEDFYNLQLYVFDKYYIELSGVFSNEKVELRDEFLRIMSTFETKFDAVDTYDLSNVKDGMRIFEDKNIGFTMSIPENFYMSSSKNSENSFDFRKFDITDLRTRISVNVFSKSSVTSARVMAEDDYKRNKTDMNAEIASFSDNVYEKTYAGIPCFEYTYEIKNSFMNDCTARDVFFEKGEYVYNVYVGFKENGTDENFNKIFESIKIEEIDADKVGTFLRNLNEDKETFESGSSSWSITLPNTYQEVAVNDTNATYVNTTNGYGFSVQFLNAPGFYHADVKNTMKQVEKSAQEEKNAKTVIALKDTTINGTKYADLTLSTDSEYERVYTRYMAYTNKGKMFVFTLTTSELGYSEAVLSEFIEIIKTFKVKF